MKMSEIYFERTAHYRNIYGEKTLFLLQVGSFFEIYSEKNVEDAVFTDVSKICGLAIGEKQDGTLMTGFPDYNFEEKHLRRLMENNYTVVLYVQRAKGDGTFVRELKEIYSPGTYFSEEAVQLSNNVLCVWIEKLSARNPHLFIGLATVDIYTGKSFTHEYYVQYYVHTPTVYDELEQLLSVFSPNEMIIISNLSPKELEEVYVFSNIQCKKVHKVECAAAANVEKQVYQQQILRQFFGDTVGMTYMTRAFSTQAFCYLLNFIYEHNPGLVKKIAEPDEDYSTKRTVMLENHALRQLNIIGDGDNIYSSVCRFLNRCKTPMGRRGFSLMLLSPKNNVEALMSDYAKIGEWTGRREDVEHARKILGSFIDIQKFARQLVMRRLKPECFVKFRDNLHKTSTLLTFIDDMGIGIATVKLMEHVDAYLDIDKLVGNNDENPWEYIRRGVSTELDEAVESYNSARLKMDEIYGRLCSLISKKPGDECIKLVEKSGTIQFTTTKLRAEALGRLVKDLVVIPGKSSFVVSTVELDKVVATICKKREECWVLADTLYKEFLNVFESKYLMYLTQLSDYIEGVDILMTKAWVAAKYNYCRPEIADNRSGSSYVNVTGVRHVLIEHLNTDELYVTNDVDLHAGMLLYGTNAVGKSSIIKALGICVIMAQAGMYVPCSSMTYFPYNKIFTRILGNDNIFKGLSTFAVEMSELRMILKHSDKNSLVLGDELCSGTETDSATAIFVAGLMTLHEKGATFIFATHFHEIVNYDEIRGLSNLALKHLSVSYNAALGKLVYDRKLRDGPGDNMYGLEVCKSMNMPSEFLETAYKLRAKYNGGEGILSLKQSHFNSKQLLGGKCEMCGIEKGQEIHHLRHQKTADANGFIDGFHKNHTANLVNLCIKCHDKIHAEGKELVKKKMVGGSIVINMA